jgi:S1-C subfamily serine protease
MADRAAAHGFEPSLPMRLPLLLAGLLSAANLVSAADAPPAPVPPAVENSVVKIFATQRPPDLVRPWSKASPREITGSGVVIEGKRILTNAHVVTYASQVQVQGNQSGEKVSATVEAIAIGIDLAVLKLEDESFFDTRPPLPRAKGLPGIKDSVMAYGYPTGGTSLSITKGIVSRIDFSPYNFPVSGLRIQIDAAINAGNSGGPALSNDQMIGVAFSRLGGGENIGYIIPNEEIELFLADIADGTYDGKPAAFDQLQPLQNPALRAFAQVPRATTGILVTEPDSDAPSYPLKRWDVITHIGDSPIDDEGMVKLGDNLRVRFGYLMQHREKNGTVPLKVLRQGAALSLDLPVNRQRPMLISYLHGQYPPYFIYGPLVFSVPSAEMFSVTSANAAQFMSTLARTGSPLITRRHERPAFAGEQLVTVSSPLLSHKLGRGYGNPALRVVASVNGVAVKNLPHLVELLRDAQEEFVVFRFSALEADAIVLPRAEVAAATDEILNDNGIRAQASAELLKIWLARP